jgi:hypothetical protein
VSVLRSSFSRCPNAKGGLTSGGVIVGDEVLHLTSDVNPLAVSEEEGVKEGQRRTKSKDESWRTNSVSKTVSLLVCHA